MITFSNDTTGALEFTVEWEKDHTTHREWFLGRKYNAVNDIFPRGMREALEGKREGDSVTMEYEPRMCIPRHKDSLVRHLTLDRLRPKTRTGQPIIPKVGRFYPQGHINGIIDVYPDTLTPFRLIELTDDHFVADCNHPLAGIPVTITATIQYIEKRGTGTYGSLTHWREATCDWGPGMQAMHAGQPTDFTLPDFLERNDDSCTVTPPPPVDDKAMANLDTTMDSIINPGLRTMDFSLRLSTIAKPYEAAICRFGLEYMTNPVSTLKKVASLLPQGAPVVIGFTSHFDPTRATKGWQELHEFERMGLALDYLRQAGLDRNPGTFSFRNDWRSKDDPRFLETRGVSDPIYVVYGHKR